MAVSYFFADGKKQNIAKVQIPLLDLYILLKSKFHYFNLVTDQVSNKLWEENSFKTLFLTEKVCLSQPHLADWHVRTVSRLQFWRRLTW